MEKVGDVARLRKGAGFAEDGGEWRADPFGDVGPAFFAGDLGDLAADGESAKIGDGERERVGDEAVDDETPVGEVVGL